MMKTIKYLSMAALLVVGAIIMSCSTSDDMPGEDQPKSQTVTVTTTISLDNGATRALDASGHKTFEAGDKIAVIYKNTSGNTVKATSVPIAAANITSGNKTATFTVTLENPKAGSVDYVYPAAMANDDGTMASIDSQDGTLATIQSKYDYARGSGTMTVSGTNATLPSNVSLVNQLAICKFTRQQDHYFKCNRWWSWLCQDRYGTDAQRQQVLPHQCDDGSIQPDWEPVHH